MASELPSGYPAWAAHVLADAGYEPNLPSDRHDRPLPPEPTAAPGGSPEKVQVLCERRRNGYHLYHPDDNPMSDANDHLACAPWDAGNGQPVVTEEGLTVIDGQQTAPAGKGRPLDTFTCVLNGESCTIQAYTKSEARAQLKRKYGRLPIGLAIKKVAKHAADSPDR